MQKDASKAVFLMLQSFVLPAQVSKSLSLAYWEVSWVPSLPHKIKRVKLKLSRVDGFTLWDQCYSSPVKSYTRTSSRAECIASVCICFGEVVSEHWLMWYNFIDAFPDPVTTENHYFLNHFLLYAKLEWMEQELAKEDMSGCTLKCDFTFMK